MDISDERDIIKKILKGDVNAFSILVKRYQKPIFNLMYRMCGSHDEAAELTQETFIKAYEKLNLFNMKRKFFPWLYSIGINVGRDFLRKRNRQRYYEVSTEELPQFKAIPDNRIRIDEQPDFERLEKALSKMPIKYRKAIILRYHHDMPIKEIAKALNLSISGVKMRLSRGIKALRNLYNVQEE